MVINSSGIIIFIQSSCFATNCGVGRERHRKERGPDGLGREMGVVRTKRTLWTAFKGCLGVIRGLEMGRITSPRAGSGEGGYPLGRSRGGCGQHGENSQHLR